MPDRDTSVSKKVKGLHKDENALDREKNLKDEFDSAKEQDNREPGSRRRTPERDGSRTIRQDAPKQQPTPPGQIRRTPDRFAAIRKLEQDRQEAEERNRAAKAWQKFQDQQREAAERGQDNERDKAPVYGNPPERKPGSPEIVIAKTPRLTPEQEWEQFQKRQREIDEYLARKMGPDPERER